MNYGQSRFGNPSKTEALKTGELVPDTSQVKSRYMGAMAGAFHMGTPIAGWLSSWKIPARWRIA